MFEVLIGLAVLAFPFAAIIGLVMAVGMRARVLAIERRFAALERRLAGIPLDGVAAPPRPSLSPEPRPTTEPESITLRPPQRAEPAAGPLKHEPALSESITEP